MLLTSLLPPPNIRLQTRSPVTASPSLTGDILDPINLNPSVKVKMSSCVSHFNNFLSSRNKQFVSEGKPIGITQYDELIFQDIDTSTYI